MCVLKSSASFPTNKSERPSKLNSINCADLLSIVGQVVLGAGWPCDLYLSSVCFANGSHLATRKAACFLFIVCSCHSLALLLSHEWKQMGEGGMEVWLNASIHVKLCLRVQTFTAMIKQQYIHNEWLIGHRAGILLCKQG